MKIHGKHFMSGSFKHKNDIEIFERGWYASRGNCLSPNKESYYSSIKGYVDNYSKFSYEPKASYKYFWYCL